MKKYIKVYNEATKCSKRVEATNNIAIETKLFADRLDVKFVDKNTGDVKINLALCIDAKEIETLCQNLIDTNLSFVVEMYMRLLISNEYKHFLDDYRQTLRINKVGQQWVLSLVMFLAAVNGDCGEEIGKLAKDIKRLFS